MGQITRLRKIYVARQRTGGILQPLVFSFYFMIFATKSPCPSFEIDLITMISNPYAGAPKEQAPENLQEVRNRAHQHMLRDA